MFKIKLIFMKKKKVLYNNYIILQLLKRQKQLLRCNQNYITIGNKIKHIL